VEGFYELEGDVRTEAVKLLLQVQVDTSGVKKQAVQAQVVRVGEYETTWWFETRPNGRTVIALVCPRCGKIGKLNVHRRIRGHDYLPGHYYVVKHERGGCRFGYLSREFEVLQKVHEEAKRLAKSNGIKLGIRS